VTALPQTRWSAGVVSQVLCESLGRRIATRVPCTAN
jgi:hypothetical protein